MWFKLVILADGKIETQKEIACSRSQREPLEVQGGRLNNLTPLISSLRSFAVLVFCPLFHLYLLHIFLSKMDLIFIKTSDTIRPYIRVSILCFRLTLLLGLDLVCTDFLLFSPQAHLIVTLEARLTQKGLKVSRCHSISLHFTKYLKNKQ